MARWSRLVSWLDSRTGLRAGLSHLLDEPIPAGVNWWFTLGSILLGLLGVQVVTGLVLTLYYAPTPDHAYDSIRFLITSVTFGRLVRSLHFFGASFIVIAAVAHLLRVFAFGAYKASREMTWITGVLLLLIILAFALSGYLLPWDQRAYWATTVALNIARSTPLVGGWVASVLQGGNDLGALTLSRWYAAHVILLPLLLLLLIVAHLALMRRHGIAGMPTPREGAPAPFYPFHAVKDTIAISLVFALLFTVAMSGRAPLDLKADPTDANYIPRPEWYFLGLFQLLKYFPGKLEPIATVVAPGLMVLLLLLLPWLDRAADRSVKARRFVIASGGVVGLGALILTMLGWRDSPASADPARWPPSALAGRAFASDERCSRCHTPGGIGRDLMSARFTHDDQWVTTHVGDPEMIAAGIRKPPQGQFGTPQAQAIAAFVKRVQAGAPPPAASSEEIRASIVFATHCAKCHRVEGIGGDEGPDLTRAAQKRDREFILTYVRDPSLIDVNATMPAFEDKLSQEDLQVIVNYMANRK
jgi:ubiquinol-cytochrome c reductase cytochrome b subunit